MTRRRFLRATSLTLLILCLAAWGWSWRYDEMVVHGRDSGVYVLGLGANAIVAIKMPQARPYSDIYDGWTRIHKIRSDDHRSAPRLIPFSFDADGASMEWWCPTLLLAALTWWTWRKTRAKDGRGFAVEAGEDVGVAR